MSRIALRCGLIAVFLGGVHQPLAFADIGDIGGAVGGVLKSATNGDADIFNSNNKIGIHIDTRPPPPQESVIDDPQPVLTLVKVDLDGYVSESVNHGPFRPIGKRAERRIDPQTGRAHWVWNGKLYPAKQLYDDKQIQLDNAKRAAAQQERQREQQQEAMARQQFAQLQQKLNNMPIEQIANQVNTLNDQQLIEAKIRLEATANALQSHNINASGLRRVVFAMSQVLQQRQIQAAQQIRQAQMILADQRARQQAEWEARQRQLQNPPIQNVGMPGPTPGDGNPPPPPADEGIYAGNIGITYTRVPYGDGTFGARIVQPPPPNSPAAKLGFEPGDIIFELDGMRFRTHQDVLAHTGETTVGFVNVRTNEKQSGSLTLP